MDKLLEEVDDIAVQIIFNTPLNTKDKRYAPTKHLLAISKSSGNEQVLHNALDDWYKAPIKEYDVFAKKHATIFLENKVYDKEIKAMYDWCNDNKISATPTIFIDGFKLPKNYSIDELAYILKD